MPLDSAPIRRQPRLGHAHKSIRPALTIAPPPSQPQHGIVATKGYDAARQDRLTSDWQVSRLSADAELQGKLPIIRDRFREQTRNEPLAKNFLFLVENNVVGDKGFSFESKVVTSRTVDPETGEEEVKYNAPLCRAVERAWGQFGHRENFLTTRNMDMTSAWKLIARTVWGDGDCLLRLVRGYPNKFGFAVQLLEPDFLDDQFIEFRGVPCNCPEELTLPDGRPFPRCERGLHQVRMGVELHGDWMFPLAYWILADHPGDYFFGNQYNTRRTRVLVTDMIHPFVYKRMGQTRGVSEMEAAMLRLQMMGGMNEAALVKARAAAQKIGLIERDVPESLADQFQDEYEKGVGILDCEPGGILDLPMGYKFKPWDPQDPSPQYEEFIKHQTRMVGAAAGVSYTSLSNDIENVNFSSIRAGLLEEREGWKGRQRFFIAEVIRPIFEAWLPMAILSQQLDAPMSMVDAIIDQEAACFQGRRWPWIDPEKDVAAQKAAVDAGFKTNSDVVAESGGAFDKVTAGLGREKRMRAAEGLLPPEETAQPDPEKPAQNDDDDASAAVKSLSLWGLIAEAIKRDGTHQLKASALEEVLAGEAIKRDGWVTINGRPVHFGTDGKVDSGTGGLLQTAKQEARSAFADKAGESAFAAGNAAHATPSPATHGAAAGAHRAAAAAHVDASQSGARATEHAGHAAMHDEKATTHDALAQSSKPQRQRRSFLMPFAPTGAADVLDHIADEGGMASRKLVASREPSAALAEYDDAPQLRGVYHHVVFGGTTKPDLMALSLHEAHGIGDGSVGGMYSEIDKAIQTRKTVQQETARQELAHKQGERFDRDALTPHKGDKAVHVGNLAVGDVLSIHGQKVKVKDIDPDTMDVTLQDHSKYGAQRVSDGQVLYVEKLDHQEASPATEDHAADLWKPESLEGGRPTTPDPSTALTPSGGPAKGHSIAKLHQLDASLDDQQRAVISRVHAAIDKTHGIVGADQITATSIRSNPDLKGALAGYRMRGPFGHIDLRPGVSNELDVIHEMGHALDHQALGTGGVGLASLAKSKLRVIKAAVERSAPVKALNRMARNARGADDPISRHIKDAVKPYEKFARAYEQYVATKSADPKLLGQLASQHNARMGKQKYWSSDEFSPILQAFDKHFSSIGWN